MICNDELSCLYSFNMDKSTEIKYLDYYNQFNTNRLYFSYDLDITNKIQDLFIK